jgi:hypothetical protein
VTCAFALPHPAPSRRPRAVSNGCGVARRRARAQARRTARSTDLQFVPVLTSFFAARMVPSAPAELALGIRRGHSLAAIRGTHRSVRSRSLAVRALARPPSSPSASRHEVPGFGAACSLVRLACWTVAPVSPRISARQPEPTVGWRDCPRLRSLLAANQWIAETSAFVESILRGRSLHSLPIESLLVPEARARPRSSRARKRGVPANAGGTGWGPWLLAGSFGPAGWGGSEEACRQAGDRGEILWRQG